MVFCSGAQRVNEAAVRWMASHLFGLRGRKEGMSRTDDDPDEWSGRMNFIKSLVKEAVQDSQRELEAELLALETVRTE